MAISFNEVNEKVFHIKVNNSHFGTTFRLDIDNNRLLVTAKHLFPQVANNACLIEIGELNQNGSINYVPLPSWYTLNPHNLADIAVIDITQQNGFLNSSFSSEFNYLPS